MEVLAMKIEDYDEAWKIWVHTKGMGLNNLDDSREGIRKMCIRDSYNGSRGTPRVHLG